MSTFDWCTRTNTHESCRRYYVKDGVEVRCGCTRETCQCGIYNNGKVSE